MIKRKANRKSVKPEKIATSLSESIELGNRSYKGKSTLYLDTIFQERKYRGKSVKDVMRIDKNYINYYINKTGCWVSDEVTIELNK